MARILSKVLTMLFLFEIPENKLSSAFEQNNTQRHILFFFQKSPEGDDNDVLLKVTRIEKEDVLEGCKLYTGKDLINKILRSSNNSPIRTLPEAEMQNLLEDCKEFNLGEEEVKDPNAVSSDATNATHFRRPILFPGTKWCGLGNIAEDYNDLGSDQDIDRCCRAHDLCKDYLPPGEVIGNIINTSRFPLLSCECDHDFYQCLTEVDSAASKTILNLYFDILNKNCFELDYPLTDKCKSYYTFLKIKCWEYEKDTTAPKVYRLILAKKYKKIPVVGPLTTESPENKAPPKTSFF